MNTFMYRQQHRALVELASRMPTRPSMVEEPEVRQLLIKFTGTLRAHLKLGDERLYPALLSHSSEDVRVLAKYFQAEMGNLAKVYNAFYDYWVVPGAIGGSKFAYVEQWGKIVAALLLRIGREDGELYYLVDRTPDLIVA